MRRWGVRHVDIEIIAWGSEEESLKVLRPRQKHRLRPADDRRASKRKRSSTAREAARLF